MSNTKITAKPLGLAGAYNVRDLGVYENKQHRKLREHQFLRADSLHELTEEDRRSLITYGARAVIDLRSRQEKMQAPCVWEKSHQVDYYSVPMLDEMNSKGFQGEMPKSMSELYIGLLEKSKAAYAEVFRIMCRYERECVIFNCTAGKDRTGVTAMLLLGLAEVEPDVIVRDYSVSRKYMEPVFRRQKEQMKKVGIEIPEELLDSREEEMETALNYLFEKYGTIKHYVQNIGLTEKEITVLKCKLCG